MHILYAQMHPATYIAIRQDPFASKKKVFNLVEAMYIIFPLVTLISLVYYHHPILVYTCCSVGIVKTIWQFPELRRYATSYAKELTVILVQACSGKIIAPHSVRH